MDRNINIQILRGIAIIAVVMIHTCPAGISQVLVRSGINDYMPFCLNSFAVLCISFIYCIIGRQVFGKRLSGWFGFQ